MITDEQLCHMRVGTVHVQVVHNRATLHLNQIRLDSNFGLPCMPYTSSKASRAWGGSSMSAHQSLGVEKALFFVQWNRTRAMAEIYLLF